jgi:hypothetical protein
MQKKVFRDAVGGMNFVLISIGEIVEGCSIVSVLVGPEAEIDNLKNENQAERLVPKSREYC